ncbi:MAG TPA: sigma-54 dependent transcriptional regulator, partial [Pyrinomonadaceae bacterium]
MADILLVEDKDSLRRVLRLTLENAGYTVAEAADARAALNEIANSRHRLILTDLRMPNGSGLDVLRSARSADADVPVIVMTAFGSIDEAVQAMKDGAHDFLQKPVDSNHLLLLVDRALEQARLRTENVLLREEWSRRYGFPRIIGESEVVKRAVAETQRVAQTEATVLLLGESGTGKELFARAVHHLSPRRDKPFVAINCAAIPETLIENELFGHERGAFTGASDRRQGKFELASGGTVFLDEIGELPLAVQGKLLRAIEEKMIDRIGGRAPVAVDVRVVAATNKDLKAAVDQGQFRGDLFFRLAVFPIEIPPLRDRGEDVTLLARHFASEIGRELRGREAQLSGEAAAALKGHHWPGNVRELENAIERACILSDTMILEPADLGLSRNVKDEPDALAQLDLSG